MDGSFGTQIKEILGKRNITIKALADMIEQKTGTRMSRQNLTQRLARDNFQEQDMQMIAQALGCTVTVTVDEGDYKYDEAVIMEETPVVANAEDIPEAAIDVSGESVPEATEFVAQDIQTLMNRDPVSRIHEHKPEKQEENAVAEQMDSVIAPVQNTVMSEQKEVNESISARQAEPEIENIYNSSATLEELLNRSRREYSQRRDPVPSYTVRTATENRESSGAAYDQARELAAKAREERLRLARKLREEEERKRSEKAEEERARIKEIARRAVAAARNTKTSFVHDEPEAEDNRAVAATNYSDYYESNADTSYNSYRKEDRDDENTVSVNSSIYNYDQYTQDDASSYNRYTQDDTSSYNRYTQDDTSSYNRYTQDDTSSYNRYTQDDTSCYRDSYSRDSENSYQSSYERNESVENRPVYEQNEAKTDDSELFENLSRGRNRSDSYGEQETLVQAAYKNSEAAAVTRNTADMGVVPDVFKRVSKTEATGPEINPRTGEEYESNVVRNHPRLKGYIQVYDRGDHKWIDMTEWAFLGFQERKKVMLGADYKPPIYLD